jgi:thiol:disulfide interchange protein
VIALLRITLALLLLPILSTYARTGEGVDASLVLDASSPLVPGQPFTAMVVLDLKPGWHTYWQYPGDAGVPTKVQWHLPKGWTVGSIEFAVPNQFSEPGDLVIYGYAKRQLLRATITPPKEIPPQAVELSATVSWLACKELCVPGSDEVSCEIAGPTTPVVRMLSSYVSEGEWPETGEPPFTVSLSGKGKTKLVSFTGKTGSTYELYPDPAEGTTVGHVTQLASPVNNGNAIVFSIPWDGTSPFHALLVEKSGDNRHAWWISKGSLHEEVKVSSAPSSLGLGVLIAALFSGFLGGLILNLMPCVLPVISLKLFSFIAQAGESPARIFRHGVAFAAGIFTWFLGLGILVIALKSGGSQVTWGAFQFQNQLFVVGLSVLVFLFALNLFGVFEITLPGSATTSLDQAAARGGYSGSFFQGLFATLLATPCTAPFLGSALGFAFGQSALVILAMFTAVALGMSLPYLLLSARPGWRSWIPKPGLWMERLKQFMGFPLLATNLWLLWVLQNQRGPNAALALMALLLLIGFAAWAYGAIQGANDRVFVTVLIPLTVFLTVGLVFLLPRIQDNPALSSSKATDGGISWIPYSARSLAALQSEGKPVFLDFTASWCLTCQFNERTAINVPAVRKVMKEQGITAMKGDWTNADPAITAALKSFGRVGVPLAVFYPAGKNSAPAVLPELLTEKIVLDYLKGSLSGH